MLTITAVGGVTVRYGLGWGVVGIHFYENKNKNTPELPHMFKGCQFFSLECHLRDSSANSDNFEKKQKRGASSPEYNPWQKTLV